MAALDPIADGIEQGSDAVVELPPLDSPARTGVSPDAGRFLIRLVQKREAVNPQSFSPVDRAFLAAFEQLHSENRLQVPILPRVATEIAALLKNPNSKVGRFVELLQSDAGLAVEVLRTANSAMSGSVRTIESVQEAVIRIGLQRLQAVVIAAFLHGRAMRAGSCEREAHWLASLSHTMAEVLRRMARDLGMPPEVAFTRGLLYHAEHFILLNTITQVAPKEDPKARPSHDVLLEAFFLYGPPLRRLAAKNWALESLLFQQPGSIQAVQLDQVRNLIVSHWTGLGVPRVVQDVDEARVERGLRGAEAIPAALL